LAVLSAIPAGANAQDAVGGAIIGAGTGAVVGGAVGGGRGAAVGAVVGGTTGAAIGANAGERRHYRRDRVCWEDNWGNRRCRYR
jgi:uncharacterized protein YcfJ